MKFKKEFLRAVLDEDQDGAVVVENKITDQGRWSTHHYMVFSWDGKFYASGYSAGSTEQQEESPYEYDEDEIECAEVVPVEKVVVVYKQVKT